MRIDLDFMWRCLREDSRVISDTWTRISHLTVTLLQIDNSRIIYHGYINMSFNSHFSGPHNQLGNACQHFTDLGQHLPHNSQHTKQITAWCIMAALNCYKVVPITEIKSYIGTILYCLLNIDKLR